MVVKPDNLSDSLVVSLVLKGDKDMYAVLVERYEAKLLRYATYLVEDYDAASDIVQEAFIKTYVNLKGFNTGKSFSSWVYRITHNEAMNAIKKNKKTATFTQLEKDEDDFFVDSKFAENIDKIFLKKEVQDCVKSLELKYQEVIALYFFEHLSYEQISDVLRIPKSTVGVRINRAKKLLKEVCSRKGEIL